jgi:hypothetical protein
MPLFEGKTPAERNKLIAALALGVLALISLAYMLFGGSSTSTTVKQTRTSARPSPIRSASPAPEEQPNDKPLTEIPASTNPPPVPEVARNIFAFYVPPPTPTPTPIPIASPTPAPPPPLFLASISPSNVFARTGDFNLEVSGDKFTPSCHLVIGGRELPTRFVNAQHLSANVPANAIATEGAPQISVRTPDGKLYSNSATLNITAPPAPNFTYIGTLIAPSGNDTAVLQDKESKEVLNVQRGDVVGGRFRVTSISVREILLIDTTLRVKHSLAFSGGTSPDAAVRGLLPRTPTRPVESDEENEP